MNLLKLVFFCLISVLIFSCTQQKPLNADQLLPIPKKSGGKPLMQALNDRQTTREFSDKDLQMQQISDLLWAANGINRPVEKKHTAPSARNKQEIEIYLAMKSGVYLFDADLHHLKKLFETDIRSEIGNQAFHKIAPVSLILVADLNKVHGEDTANTDYDAIDAGYISQNIYLYCASENLATVAVGWLNHSKIDSLLHLHSRQRVLLAHPVGFKK